MKSFIAAACLVATFATPCAGLAQNQWFNPTTRPTYMAPRPLPVGTPVYLWAKSNAMACPSMRDLIYFYRSGLDFGDETSIETWMEAHNCWVLPWGKKYLATSYTQPVTMVELDRPDGSVITNHMYVRTDQFLGPMSEAELSREKTLGILRENPQTDQ